MQGKRMSLHKPLYARFNFKGITLEGEYVPQWTDYFSPEGCDTNPLTEPGLGYIRPFDKEYRQSIIDRNMAMYRHDYESFMRLGDIVECDAFVSSDKLCRVDNALLVQDLEMIEEKELSVEKKEMVSCRIDIVHRMLRLSKNMADSDPELISTLEEVFNKLETDDYIPLRYKRVTLIEKISSLFKIIFGKNNA